MKSGFTTSSILGTAVAAAMFTTLGASAQCVINPNPTVVQNDACAGQTTDPNGGCNSVPAAFQNAGTFSSTNTLITINGTVGTDAAASTRDLDWYSFTMAEAGFVTWSATSLKPDGVTPASNLIVWVLSSTDCATYTVAAGGFASAGVCPFGVAEVGLAAGNYVVLVSVDFNAADVCDITYTLTGTTRYSSFAVCGDPASGDCALAHATGGCTDLVCCDLVCTANPLCCDIGWDASCVSVATTPASQGGCGIFLYNCTPGSPANAPANNCATAGAVAQLGQTYNFDITNATTDGPNDGSCGSETFKDVWYVTQAQASGNLYCTVTSAGFDSVIGVYDLGASSSLADGANLPNLYVGCVDVNGIGGEAAYLGVTAGNYYLWRLGIWGNPGTADPGVPGPGSVIFELEEVVYATGTHAPVRTPAGAATNLGLSSGAISATSTQRWFAAPFVVADPVGPATKWQVSRIEPEGFTPAGAVNENLNWIIFNRTGSNKPIYPTDQRISGTTAFPALGGAGEAPIFVDFELVPGTYYLTQYASAAGNPCVPNDGGAVFSNFAWFVGAPNGLVLSDATGPFAWRSVQQPVACNPNGTAGFVRYTLGGAYVPCAGTTQNTELEVAFSILGTPTGLVNPCPTDLNANGSTEAADLAILLGQWGVAGGTADFNGGGVDASDLAILLGAWGACP